MNKLSLKNARNTRDKKLKNGLKIPKNIFLKKFSSAQIMSILY